MTGLTGRMLGAALLDRRVIEEIEADRGGTGQAALVVVLISIAAGVGMLRLGPMSILSAAIAALVGWAASSIVIYIVGAKLIPGRRTDADLGQLLRVLAFAASPAVLQIFGVLPCLGGLIALLSTLWVYVVTFVAVHAALDHEGYGRTVAVCLLGLLANMAVHAVLAALGLGASLVGGWSN